MPIGFVSLAVGSMATHGMSRAAARMTDGLTVEDYPDGGTCVADPDKTDRRSQVSYAPARVSSSRSFV